ncbi:MAG: chromosome segregation protein SMC [Lachnospiraceae bacterium]
MYLKSIEVQGFKSFANKIKFEFHNGITGIVGPNGSGKSNVADAVRWVLGEQSAKQLRGSNMQDVIFSGTENRKPQSYAYVSITLDNSDHQLSIEYDEVTVTRRVYRSGESEYRINGSACRLKDINELFYDTGIGKEGYSIIGQGQIDQILSGKPEERRELFDEAAGIVKFKRRKAVALKRLEEERANMVRVNDILSELEKQVGPLKEQAETARTYLRLKETLKVYDVHSFLLERDHSKELLVQLDEKIRIAQGDLDEVRRQSDRQKEKYEALENEMAHLEERISQGQEALNRAVVEKGNLSGRIDVMREQINTEKMNEEHIENRTRAIAGEMEERRKEKEELEQRQTTIRQQIYDLEIARQRTRAELEQQDGRMAEFRQASEADKEKMIRLLNEKSSFAAQSQRVETMLEQAMIRRAELAQKLILSKSEEEKRVLEEKTFADEILRLEEEKTALKEEQDRLSAQMEETEKKRTEASRRLAGYEQESHAAKTRADYLRNLAERYEGYGASIRKVMEIRSREPGIHGVVADLIHTEKMYETAIETALGGSIQNIVTDTDQTAKRLIEYLKKNRYGRATFLPLNGIQTSNTFHQQEVLKEPGIIGLASSLVSAGQEYKGLISHLLGRVVVAETIDDAIRTARKYRYSVRIVTLEGELLNTGGSMTGGAFKNNSNLLGRSREIEELEKKAEASAAKREKARTALEEAQKKQTELRKQAETLTNRLQSNRIAQTEARLNQKQAGARIEEVVHSRADCVAETKELEEKIKEIRAEEAKLEQSIGVIDRENRQAEEAIREYSEALKKEQEIRDGLAKKSEEMGFQYANLTQSEQFAQENRERITGELEKLLEEKRELETRRESSCGVIAAREEEIGQMLEKIREKEKEAASLSEETEKLIRLKEEKQISQKKFFSEREDYAKQDAALDKELFRLNAQREKQEEILDERIQYLWTEYELIPSEAEKMRQEEYSDLSATRKQAGELRSQIKALGNVNVNAIEAYQELSERYDFMKGQHDDLVEAEASLVQVIDELDVGMRRQFEEKFEDIRREFDKVFKELFGGGKGTLELTEGEDIIEAGIRIISQPPGKKLQNMMQLSGGEKALTAIALLFAIQNLKPSPFCLLDEIEAALDDSNVGRFSGYLHKLTEHTQFIVITHRRGTMVAADRLYGITMQEKGVSTLVSVNLVEQELK